MKLSIIIPVFNEERTLSQLIDKVMAVKLPKGVSREIVVVDDCSNDRSWKIVQSIQHLSPRLIKGYQNPINLGKGATVRHGIAKASGQIIIIQDADLELDPGVYPELIDPILKKKAKVVYGSRFLKPNHQIPWRIRFNNRLLTFITNLFFMSHLTDMETCYKVFLKNIFNKANLRCVGFDFEPEITSFFLKSGYDIMEIPISYIPRNHSQGKKMRLKDGVDALAALITVKFFN